MLAATILSPHFTRKQTSPGVAGRSAQGQRRTLMASPTAPASPRSCACGLRRLLVHNRFRPRFLGRFQTFDGRVILLGQMVGANGQAHLVVGAGLAMSLFFAVGTLLALMKGSHDPAL